LTASLREHGGPASNAFEIALEAWGYVPKEDYDQPVWLLTERRLFEVLDGFPRITPAMLSPGIQNVSYAVLLSECAPFAVDLKKTMDGVFF
jgi:hypothetical protein